MNNLQSTIKERPIIFSTEMVKAILEGRKTQTRRVLKAELGALYYTENDSKCPYGKPGDRLWVRESWKIIGWNDGEPFFIQYKDGETKSDVMLPEDKCEDYWIQCSEECHKAGLKTNDDGIFIIDGDVPTKWRPSIFMPREASRIILEITNIKLERLNDISEEDCQAEGVQWLWNGNCEECYQWSVTGNKKSNAWFDYAEDCYKHLWNSIHKKENTWKDNPWVWVIEFKRINN